MSSSPRHDRPRAAGAGALEPERALALGERPTRGGRVLVCDADKRMQRAYQVILRGADYDVMTIGSGRELLDLFARTHPRAVIVEPKLADLDGVELCRRLRELGETPIIVVSEVGDESAKIDLLDAGADDYLTKPFGVGELVARLGAALRRVPEQPRVEANGLVIDFADQHVTIDGRDVHLTPIEFSLLRVLATSRGPVGHRALATRVWGPVDSDCEPRLRTHIARLRAKLQGERYRNVIRTEVGVGYRFAGAA